jgi:hypothetical protein
MTRHTKIVVSRILVHLLGPITHQLRMFGICSTSHARWGSGATQVALYCSRRGGSRSKWTPFMRVTEVMLEGLLLCSAVGRTDGHSPFHSTIRLSLE